MADGDGGVGVHEQNGHGFADDVAAAENNGVCAFDGDAVAVKDLHAARGRAGDESGAAADQATEIYGMKAVHAFCGINALETPLGLALEQKGKLVDNPAAAISPY